MDVQTYGILIMISITIASPSIQSHYTPDSELGSLHILLLSAYYNFVRLHTKGNRVSEMCQSTDSYPRLTILSGVVEP